MDNELIIYPEEATDYLDEHFPKGHPERGKVLAILSIAFIEGQKAEKNNRKLKDYLKEAK